MILYNYLPYERFYEAEHMQEVLIDLRSGFDRYFPRFAISRDHLKSCYDEAIKSFSKDQSIYQELLEPEELEEFEYDPGAFKGEFARSYPIIRRTLQSQAAGMDKYRIAFYGTNGQPMLNAVQSIADFAQRYRSEVTNSIYDAITTVDGFGFAELDADGEEEGQSGKYTVRGVIGGGIRSHLLYHLHPDIFPNRSQSAIWALYFMTDRKKYGFEDDSEFLMINADNSGTQQNYFYPYDLFTYYAFHLYNWLKEASEAMRCYMFRRHRYVYVDTFLSHVTLEHDADITSLRPPHERRED